MKNYTLVIPTSLLPTDVIGTLLGVAKARGIQHVWPNNALLCAINPALADHRDFEAGVKSAGLETHVRE